MRFVVLFPWLVQSSLPFQALWKDGLLVDVHKATLSWDYCYLEGGNHKICECATVLLSLPKTLFPAEPLHCLHPCLKVSGFSWLEMVTSADAAASVHGLCVLLGSLLRSLAELILT